MTLKSLFLILSMPEYETQNDLHLSHGGDNISFYERYYKNPRKLRKKQRRHTNLFTKDNVGENLGTILENVYKYSQKCKNLDSEAMLVLRIIFTILGDRLSNYKENICKMFGEFFKKIKEGYTYSTIKNLVECASVFIDSLKGNTQNEDYLTKNLIPVINEVMNLQINDISSLILQLYSLMMREYTNPPVGTITALMTSLTDINNYSQANISLYPSYSIFFEELIRREPSYLGQGDNSKNLMQVCVKFIELRMDGAFFKFYNAVFDKLSQDDMKNSGWLNFLVDASINVLTGV